MTASQFPKLIDRARNTEVPLSGRVITLGSARDCHVRINDQSLPPFAAHLLFTGGSYQIQALDPGADVTLNTKAVGSQTPLHHGDTISIGGNEFVYAEYQDAGAAPVDPEQTGSGRFLDDLIGITISLLRDRAGNVFDDLVAAVSRLLRSDASRLVKEDPHTAERKTIARYPGAMGLDRYSNHAIEWAKDESKTVLIHDADWKEKEQTAQSLEKNLVSSVLCSPLKAEGAIIGYLYLDRLQHNELFTEKDRQLLDSLIPLFSEIVATHLERERQRETIERLQKTQVSPSGGMIFESGKMHDVMLLGARVAKTDSPVLVLGETGTGKELMARFIHEQSQRAGKVFKAINCGAIPENLIESELFGYEKGAFTGAANRKIGLFEAACGGTLFMDEIGELPLQLQVKLLRVLQQSEVIRVGGTETISIDVRIIAATNKNIEKEVEAGRFRNDLFYRLNVLTLQMPPLRERGQDVLLLADYLVIKYCQQFGLTQKTVSSQAKKVLLKHTWPGNIRELENIMQKAILLSATDRILPQDIEIKTSSLPGTDDNQVKLLTLKDARYRAEMAAIEQVLEKTKGNVSLSADMLDIDRKWLMKKMKEFGLDADEFRE